MPDFGAYGFYILGAYGLSVFALFAFVIVCVLDAKTAAKALRAEQKE